MPQIVSKKSILDMAMGAIAATRTGIGTAGGACWIISALSGKTSRDKSQGS